MARAAGDALDPEAGSAGADGDAVVAGPDVGANDVDVGRHLDVDAVGVGAASGRLDVDVLQLDVFALKDHDVEKLAVDRRQAIDGDVL